MVPVQVDIDRASSSDSEGSMNDAAAVAEGRPLLMGQVAGAIEEILSAKQIIDDMMHSATETIQNNYRMLSKL